jgi:predicted transposase YbfD/YdcC
MVSAFATETGIVFAQQGVADKGSETAALPELLRALEIRGCLVSLDALGCQHEIAEVIRERKADYLLSVKGNQPNLKTALEQAFADESDAPAYGHAEKGHGRRCAQIAQVIPNSGQVDSSLWSDCQSLARIRSIRCEANKPEHVETRYYISSAQFNSETLALAVRRHWAIENDLHWRLEVTLSEDACTVRRDHAPQNRRI